MTAWPLAALRQFALSAAICVAGLPAAIHAQDLLDADVAFRTTARLAGPNRIEVRYETAPGYYLYRDRLSFALTPETARLGKPKLPPGKVKKDEFFGRQVIYRRTTVVTIPVTWDGTTDLTLTADLQGCADLGVCYPPVRRTFSLSRPAAGGK